MRLALLRNLILRIIVLSLLASACDAPDPRYEASTQCPEALRAGIKGPGLVPCEIKAVRDRRDEFERRLAITATCHGEVYLQCSGVTEAGKPVRFKCNSTRCEYIAPWLW